METVITGATAYDGSGFFADGTPFNNTLQPVNVAASPNPQISQIIFLGAPTPPPHADPPNNGNGNSGDNPPTKTTYYQDADRDGWGNSNVSQQLSGPQPGWVTRGGDYNDHCYNIDNDPEQCVAVSLTVIPTEYKPGDEITLTANVSNSNISGTFDFLGWIDGSPTPEQGSGIETGIIEKSIKFKVPVLGKVNFKVEFKFTVNGDFKTIVSNIAKTESSLNYENDIKPNFVTEMNLAWSSTISMANSGLMQEDAFLVVFDGDICKIKERKKSTESYSQPEIGSLWNDKLPYYPSLASELFLKS